MDAQPLVVPQLGGDFAPRGVAHLHIGVDAHEGSDFSRGHLLQTCFPQQVLDAFQMDNTLVMLEEVVEHQQGMGLTAAEGGLELDHPLPNFSRQPPADGLD